MSKLTTIKPRCLKTTDAAKYLGLSPRGLLDMTRLHKIPHVRLGTRTIVYDLQDLDEFVETRRVAATEKPSQGYAAAAQFHNHKNTKGEK